MFRNALAGAYKGLSRVLRRGGNDAGGYEIRNLGAPTEPSSAARLEDVAQAGAIPYPEIYISPTGSDSNTGTSPGEPLLTLAAAMNFARLSSVATTIFVAAGDYDGLSALFRAPPIGLRIIGSEFVELVSEMEVSAFDSVSRTLTVTPDPGWTAREWEGAFCEWVSGPTEVVPEARTKLISGTGSNTLRLAYPQLDTANATAIVPGCMVRVVKPAARFVVNNEIAPLVGGAVGGIFYDAILSETPPLMENLEFRNIGASRLALDGAWEMNGVRFVQTLPALWTVSATELFGGVGGYPFGSNQTPRGWGVALLNEGGTRRPTLETFFGGLMAYVVGGRLRANSAKQFWMGGTLRDTTAGLHGVWAAQGGCQFFTFSDANFGRHVIEGAGADIYLQGGSFLELFAAIVHEGSGDFLEAQYGSVAQLGREIQNTGTGGGLKAEYGGQIRLTVAGASYGAASAGATSGLGGVTRPAGAWASGEAVCDGVIIPYPRDLSNIYRS